SLRSGIDKVNATLNPRPIPSSAIPFRISLAIFLTLLARASGHAAELELTLQARDPATGQRVLKSEKVDPARVGVIAVDVWNYHWCKTATMRVDAIVPRMNKAL